MDAAIVVALAVALFGLVGFRMARMDDWIWALPRWVRLLGAGLFVGLLLLAGFVRYARGDTKVVCNQSVYGYSVAGDVTMEGAEAFARFIVAAKRAGARLEIEVSSQGGNADAGLAMRRALVTSGLHSTCTARGWAASAAAAVFVGCTRRVAAKESVIGFHSPYAMFTPALRVVTLEMAEAIYHRVTSMAALMDSVSAAAVGLTVEKFREKTANGEYLSYTAEEALKIGLVHAVVD